MTHLSSDDIEKYARQIALATVGPQGQLALCNAKILVVGAGGLGCPALLYLAASGVGNIGVADFDVVAKSNLPRQILFSIHDIGLPKAKIAAQKLQFIHPNTHFEVFDMAINTNNAFDILQHFDIIVDCTDNFNTRYLLDATCQKLKKQLVYASIFKNEGQITVFHVHPNCSLQKLYPNVHTEIATCHSAGVMATHTGMLGMMQANEVIKIILNKENILSGKVLNYNFDTNQQWIFEYANIEKSETKKVIKTIFLYDFLELQIQDTFLIDVRTKAEFLSQNIGGFHLPAQNLDAILSKISNQNEVFLYCNTGSRSRDVANAIRNKNNYIDIFVIV